MGGIGDGRGLKVGGPRPPIYTHLRTHMHTQNCCDFTAAHASGGFDKLRPYFEAEPSQSSPTCRDSERSVSPLPSALRRFNSSPTTE